MDYRKNNKWKSLADSSQDSSSNLIKGKVRRRSSSDESPPRKCRNNSPHNSQDSDASPPRRGNYRRSKDKEHEIMVIYNF